MHLHDHSNSSSRPGGGQQNLDDDFVLMDAIAHKDPSALARLYDRYSAVVHALCLRILRDPAAAEDVTIDVFQELWARADRYTSSRGSPVAYIMMLARSRALDKARSRGAHPAAPIHETPEAQEQASQGNSPLQIALDDERSTLIRQALDKLDPKYREVLECSFFEGLSHTEIALKLQKPIGTIKTYLRRGLIQLRDFLRNPDEGNPTP